MHKGTLICLILGLTSCGGSQHDRTAEAHNENRRSSSMTSDQLTNDQGRCDATQPGRETSEYDTSGDDIPDVRKVFITMGEGRDAHLILVCREADLNGDGTKDVVRYYNDEGRPLREESDRNFDGTMDEVTVFENGRIVRQEMDTSGDGRVDMKVFWEDGHPERTERDMAARSTATQWQPDRWEYFEQGRMVRMGTDLDGDGNVDRWDRDQEFQDQLDAQRAREEQQAEATTDGGVEGSEGTSG